MTPIPSNRPVMVAILWRAILIFWDWSIDIWILKLDQTAMSPGRKPMGSGDEGPL